MTSLAVAVLAGLTLASCALLLVRLAIGRRRRLRFDAAVRRAWGLAKRGASAPALPFRRRAARRHAARMAEETIRRARERAGGVNGRAGKGPGEDGDWDGNVYRPKSFRRPRKPH